MILLVDDDPLYAYVRKAALDKAFPDVRRVSAPEALCLIEQPGVAEQLALIISGTQQHGLSCDEFVAEIHARYPLLPVLVLECGQKDPSSCAHDSIHMLPEPVEAEALPRIVHPLLAQHKASAA